jgi:hypothetical protein
MPRVERSAESLCNWLLNRNLRGHCVSGRRSRLIDDDADGSACFMTMRRHRGSTGNVYLCIPFPFLHTTLKPYPLYQIFLPLHLISRRPSSFFVRIEVTLLRLPINDPTLPINQPGSRSGFIVFYEAQQAICINLLLPPVLCVRTYNWQSICEFEWLN